MLYKKTRFLLSLLVLLLLTLQAAGICNAKQCFNEEECKDIVAIGDATAGGYNLLLKVRDPSRPGLQVLCIVNRGYEYDYHSPSILGKKMHFKVERKFIGVVTKGDAPPNIVKAGMALSDAGIAYGDADSPIGWVRINKNAWDDFDWIRYACQTAKDEEEACTLMTKDVVEKMHAPGVAENLFIVGPKKAFLIEADAYHYKIKEIKDVLVMSNYPKELWNNRPLRRLFLSSSFDKTVEKIVKKGSIVRLGSLLGVKIVDIGDRWIMVKRFPFGKRIVINEGEEKTVDFFRVKLIECNGKKATIRVCYKYYAWEQKMMNYILQKYGGITVRDMMNWSRLHSNDLDGLRGMCEGGYEASMIYKIPYEDYNLLSMGWFAPNQCSSIFIPVHICVKDIYAPYKSGKVAEISLKLLEKYGHGTLTPLFEEVENVFLKENEEIENIVKNHLKNKNQSVISEIFTVSDTEMQRQAFITLTLWLNLAELGDSYIAAQIGCIWDDNYYSSIMNIKRAINNVNNEFKEKLSDIVLSIGRCKAYLLSLMGNTKVLDYYDKSAELFMEKRYTEAFKCIEDIFKEWNKTFYGEGKESLQREDVENNKGYFVLTVFVIVGVIIVLLFSRYYGKK
jgi:hypothetical protein